MSRVVTASYESREDAKQAAARLVAAGLLRQEISMLAPEDNGGSFGFSIERRRRTLSGVGGGALVGLLIGAAFGVALALLPNELAAIPGFDRLPIDFAAIGPVFSALMGAGAGAAVAALLGALVGLFRTDHEAVLHEEDEDEIPERGYYLVGVAVPREMLRSTVSVLASAGAYKIKRR